MEKKKFQHPEGKIQLIDGRVLDCYPLEQPQYEVNNQLSLDTTGVYLSLKRPNNDKTVIDNRDDEEKELEKLFLDNAFVFLENREKILSDSRMFLCPLPFSRSGLAYSGASSREYQIQVMNTAYTAFEPAGKQTVVGLAAGWCH